MALSTDDSNFESWSCRHFSRFQSDGELPVLLRTIAHSIEQLKDVILLDVVFAQEDSGGWNCTVYFGEASNDEDE